MENVKQNNNLTFGYKLLEFLKKFNYLKRYSRNKYLNDIRRRPQFTPSVNIYLLILRQLIKKY